jgi:hypothetical protein
MPASGIGQFDRLNTVPNHGRERTIRARDAEPGFVEKLELSIGESSFVGQCEADYGEAIRGGYKKPVAGRRALCVSGEQFRLAPS